MPHKGILLPRMQSAMASSNFFQKMHSKMFSLTIGVILLTIGVILSGHCGLIINAKDQLILIINTDLIQIY